MKLHDPLFMTSSGEPVTGKMPPVMRIGGPGFLSSMQFSQVTHAYKLFCDAARLSIADYFVQHRVLTDGTKVTMKRIQKQDFVDVTDVATDGSGDGAGLIHGFCVEGSWVDPQVLGLKNSSNKYPVFVRPPQASKGLFGTHQLVYFNGAPEPRNFRVVPAVAAGNGGAWDMAWHKAQTSAGRPKPIPLKIAGSDRKDFWHSPHFGGGSSIYNGDGTGVYTMTEPSTILVDDPTPSYFPAQANAIGTLAVLQGVRFAYVNENLDAFAFRSEVVHRIAPAVPPADPPVEYVLDQAQSLFMYVPLATAVVNAGTGGAGLNEEPANVVSETAIVPGSYSGPVRDLTYGNYITRADGYIGSYGWYDVPGETYTATANENVVLQPLPVSTAFRASVAGYSYWARTTSTKAPKEVKEHAIALMGVTDCEYASIEHDIGYPQSTYFRNGEEAWSLGRAIGAWTGGGAGYGVTYASITRRDLEVSTITPITSTLKLLWTDVKILEGNVNSVAGLAYYIDRKDMTFREAHYANSIFFRPNIAGELPSSAPLPTPQTGYPDYTPLIPAGTIMTKPDIFTPYLAGNNMNPALLATQAEHNADVGYGPGVGITITTDTPLTNSVDYSYTTRHVIDYDHKGRFYVAIRVTVTCTGATWGEVSSPPWRGASEVKTDPSYTVSIVLEVKWGNNAMLEKTLFSGSCTRPCFEAVRLRYPNLYHPLGTFKDDPLHDIFVRVAPQVNVPSGSYAQLYNLAYPQETSDRLVCADVFAGTDFSDPALASTAPFDFSHGDSKPQKKYRPGVLYHRTLKLSDFSSALYLISACKIDCTENNLPQPVDAEGNPSGPPRPTYFYMPALKTCIETEEFNILIRDGVFEDWTVDLVGATDLTKWPRAPKERPADPKTWNLKLSRI